MGGTIQRVDRVSYRTWSLQCTLQASSEPQVGSMGQNSETAIQAILCRKEKQYYLGTDRTIGQNQFYLVDPKPWFPIDYQVYTPIFFIKKNNV